MTEATKDTIFMIIAFIICVVLFIGIPTENGMYLGYFWKFSVYVADVFNLGVN